MIKVEISISKYHKFIREQHCLVANRLGAEVAHLKAVGMGRKRSNTSFVDWQVVPMIRKYHNKLHELGVKEFEKRYKINLFYWSMYYLSLYLEENLGD